ncbi:hypothetical protein Fmac_002050 [Flemingia macrophylla]|uniref:Uncharacterized protein n=1 Tax=Flemingia macrophylla TaxID=520843 RepID=A0ABD1NLN1_9FABA
MPSSHFSNGDSKSLLHLPLLSSQRSIVNSTSQVAIVDSNVSPIESLDYESVFPSLFHLVNVQTNQDVIPSRANNTPPTGARKAAAVAGRLT